jgi:hypothetical protein
MNKPKHCDYSISLCQVCKHVYLPEFARQQVQPTLYSYNVLRAATREFHHDNKLGEGAFGVVYKVNLSTAYLLETIFQIYVENSIF